MTEANKKRINVYIPNELYVKVTQSRQTLTEAIVNSLELYYSDYKPVDEVTQDTGLSPDSLNLYEARIKELQNQIKVNDDNKQARIDDLKLQIQALYDELHIKNEQIKDQNENVNKQAFHIQTLLTQKAIEAPGAKKPWWQFW
jgi:peptidoglycan hydrolase CwlO-like protein